MDKELIEDLHFRINRAKELNQLTEAAKLILWGLILEAKVYDRISTADVDELVKELDIDKGKYWQDFEVAWFGEIQTKRVA